MSKLIKGLGVFSLGFVLAIVYCFTTGFSKTKPSVRSISSFASPSDGSAYDGVIYALGNVTAKFSAQPANSKVIQPEPINPNKQLLMQSIREREQCESVERYRKNNPTNDLNYISLLKSLTPRYCGEQTRKDVTSALADFSLQQSPAFRRQLYFDTVLLRIFREFADEDTRVAKALANFYVVLAHDAWQGNLTKLSASFLETSLEIHPNLPAQYKMSALLNGVPYNNSLSYVPRPSYEAQTTEVSGGKMIYIFIIFAIVICPALLYWLRHRQMRSMDIDVLMKKYDFNDEPLMYDLEKAIGGEEQGTVSGSAEIEITTNDTNPKVISLYKGKGNSPK